MNFDQAFERVIGHEGGYTDDPRDRGNWTTGKIGQGVCKGTKYGISAMAYPNIDIKNLTIEGAKTIYRSDYWNKCHIDELPDCVRFDMFDAAVNSGIGTAVKLMQRALGVKPDGIWGANTSIAASLADPYKLDKKFSGYRLQFICDLGTFPTYGKGWVRRVAANLIED